MALLSEQTPGSIVKIQENGVLVDFLVLQQGYPEAGNGNVLLLRKELLKNRSWGNHNAYASSGVDTWLNNTYFSDLDAQISEKILSSEIECTVGNGDQSKKKINRKIFLLSYTELKLSGYDSNVNIEGTPIAYFDSNSKRIAYQNGAPVFWWTRTPVITDSLNAAVMFVTNAGAYGARSALTEFAVRPAFCLPGTLYVDYTGQVVTEKPTSKPLSELVPGEIVKIKENNLLTDFIVLQHGYSGQIEGTLLWRKELPTWNQSFNSNNAYKNSVVDVWLTTEYYNSIESKVREKIMNSTIQYTVGNGSSELTSMDRKIFLLSYTEVGFSGDTDVNVEGTKIEYFTDNSKRMGYLEGVPKTNFLRSAQKNNTSGVWVIDAAGGKGAYSAGIFYWARPAFCVPTTAIVTETGELEFNQPPTTPTNLQVSSPILSDKPVTLSWTASTDPEGALAGYIAQRKLDSGEFTEFYRGSNAKCTDSGVPFGTQKVTYRVCAYDTENLQSGFVTSEEFTVVNNHDPVIDGEDKDLGELSAAPAITYTATDEDSGDTLTSTITLDDVQLTTSTITSGQQQTYQVTAEQWLEVLNGSHTIKITVTDQNGGRAVRTLTFSKNTVKIVVENTEPVKTDAAARRIVLTLGGLFSAGSSVKVEVCNNGFDEAKSWEDATSKLTTGGKYIFINDTKTAAEWGVCWRLTIERGSADGEVWISSGSGACDD